MAEVSEHREPDIITRLFGMDLGHVLQTIFLHLDPASLANCSRVCGQWHQFVHTRIWGSPRARLVLERRLERRWREEEPSVRQLEQLEGATFKLVAWVACDDTFVLCSSEAGLAMYRLTTGLKVREFDEEGGWGYLKIGTNVVTGARSCSGVCIWGKKTGELLLRETEVQSSLFLSHWVKGDVILTAIGRYGETSSDELVRMYVYEEGVVRMTHKFEYFHQEIEYIRAILFEIDIDGQFILTKGIEKNIKLWKTSERSLPPSDGSTSPSDQQPSVGGAELVQVVETGNVFNLVLSHPHAITVGGEAEPGVRVWDLLSGTMIRHVTRDTGFRELLSNGSIIAASAATRGTFTDLFSVKDLTSGSNTDDSGEEIWTRRLELETACINKTTLFTMRNGKVASHCFWV